eukprot:TRINITY_DN60635_c0_g1_i1.p1 TRINITY_DN60635_c0_g1~~TRINITY_DN60635_c0_g1_i1.p1  ORF type:complete len:148 (+),score=22.32 TRINITY_DN60635_c0_g1_i1:67-444(+)
MSSISGFAVQGGASVVGALSLEDVSRGAMDLKDDISTTTGSEDGGSDSECVEEINVKSWSTVGRRIHQSISELDFHDDYDLHVKLESEPVDVKSWAGVGSRIWQCLADLDSFEPEDDFVPKAVRN